MRYRWLFSSLPRDTILHLSGVSLDLLVLLSTNIPTTRPHRYSHRLVFLPNTNLISLNNILTSTINQNVLAVTPSNLPPLPPPSNRAPTQNLERIPLRHQTCSHNNHIHSPPFAIIRSSARRRKASNVASG